MEGIILEKEAVTDRADIIYIYRKLVASLTEIKGFDGWMIAKAEFRTEEKGCNILKDTGNNIKFIKMRKVYSVISANIIYNNIEYGKKSKDMLNKKERMAISIAAKYISTLSDHEFLQLLKSTEIVTKEQEESLTRKYKDVDLNKEKYVRKTLESNI